MATVMLFGDEVVNQNIGARVEGQNLIFFFKDKEPKEPYFYESYNETMKNEYEKAKQFGFEGDFSDYFAIRDYS